MGEDWTKLSRQQIALLKLDFAKVFDSVDHSFIWDTLRSMGFDKLFITLLKGLVQEGTSKVQFHGIFTPKIQLQCGVC